MIKTILFDLDNTLFDFTKAEGIALAKTLVHFGINPEKEILERYSVINLAQWKLLELKKITRAELKIRRYKLLFEEFGFKCSPEEAAKTYEEFLSMGHYFMDGAEELLENLCKKYNLYVITNGITKVQKGRIKSANLKKYFKDIFISEEIGYDKPSIEYFEHCFEKIEDFKKENAVIIGDSLSSDIQGGVNAGVKTIWFNPKGEKNNSSVKPDYEVSDLKEIEKLLEKI